MRTNFEEQFAPHTAFMTGKAVCSKNQPEEPEREGFVPLSGIDAEGMVVMAEVSSSTRAVRGRSQALPGDTKIVGTRWAHTDENSKPRLIAYHMAKKTDKTKEEVDKEYPCEAKSRLVVQGCQEDETNIRSDSPTCSLLAFNLVCTLAALFCWVIAAFDASTANLQSSGINRLLIPRCPRPPPPGVHPMTLFRARGSIHGTKDAGRRWWMKRLRDATDCGWIASKALFFLYDGGVLIGVMASHVDDLITCGAGEKHEKSMKDLTNTLHLKKKSGEFRFYGKNLVQPEDKSISLEQVDAIEGLEYQVLDKHRRKFPNLPLAEQENSDSRALIGSTGWVVRQTRPDIMVNVSIASQSIGNPTIRDVIELNTAVKMLKDSADAKWCFKASGITVENCVVLMRADSSFANTGGFKSQCGYIIGLTLHSITEGKDTPIIVIEANSSSIKRVCRSTLAAKANAYLAAEFALKPVIGFTDAKSLESTITKDAGQPSDKRVKILVAQVREMMEGVCATHWLDTSQMLADVVTKLGCEREPLPRALADGFWRIAPSEEALEKKMAIRAGRRQRKSSIGMGAA